MGKAIEVEIRGALDEGGYARLKEFMDAHATAVESHDRVMYLLQDYAGYADDFVGRATDIRLRNTDGRCEIMLKQKMGGAREEISLALKDTSLDTAIKIVKALGCTSAIKMHRLKEVYTYNYVEWSLVKCPPSSIMYWEAELTVFSESEVAAAHATLEAEACTIDLIVYTDDETRNLITRLDAEANTQVDL